MISFRRPTPRQVAAAQAAYYVPTSIAPFVSRRRFESITGPKRDWWLVLTVGALVGIDGVVLGSAAGRRALTPELRLLGAGAAAGLGAIDIIYAARRRIAPTYFLDGAIQLVMIAGWLTAREASPRARSEMLARDHRGSG
jgi:hypothetical protein